jgi:hypothetical protein
MRNLKYPIPVPHNDVVGQIFQPNPHFQVSGSLRKLTKQGSLQDVQALILIKHTKS